MRHFQSRVDYRKFVARVYEQNHDFDGSDEYTIAKTVLANAQIVGEEVAVLTSAEPWSDERVCPIEVLANTNQELDHELIAENQLWAAAVEALAADLRSLDSLERRIWQ